MPRAKKQNAPTSYLKIVSLEVYGMNGDDIVMGLEEVQRLVRAGFTSGHNDNESGGFKFSINEEEFHGAQKIK